MGADEATALSGRAGGDAAARAGGALAELRDRIDRIDGELQRLIVERSRLVEAIGAAKGGSAGGPVIRPDREAAILARLAAHHDGPLPLAVVAHVWRTLIAAFCQLQRPFTMVAAGSDPATRDLARYHAGFAVPVETAADPDAAIDALVQRPGDVAVVPLGGAERPWWERLQPDGPHALTILPGALAGRPGADALVIGGCGVGPPGEGPQLFAITGSDAAGPPLATAPGGRILVAAETAPANAGARPLGRVTLPPAALVPGETPSEQP